MDFDTTMKSTRNFGLLALLWLTMSAIGFGAPIVTLTNVGQDYNIAGGGEFHATINGTTAVEMFCIDWQNHLTSSTYAAYLSDATDLTNTRYGNNAASNFLVEPASPNLTAIQRYTMAAWLISQITLNPANLTQDTYYQEAIWNILTQAVPAPSGNPPGYGNSNVNSAITAALSYKDNATVRSSFHVLTSTNTSSFTTGQQEYMYLSGVPEPATFALIGLGLCGLAVIRRRKAEFF